MESWNRRDFRHQEANCRCVTIQHFPTAADRPGHTLMRIVKKDADNGEFVAMPEPGYDENVPRYFRVPGSGGSIGADWNSTPLYCDAPSNEDLVYRHNRRLGGRCHGVKFNGARDWIADNHLENLNDNAVLAGYVSEVSGHSARDVVVDGNAIVCCGWKVDLAWPGWKQAVRDLRQRSVQARTLSDRAKSVVRRGAAPALTT
jgi:hypothetical protein